MQIEIQRICKEGELAEGHLIIDSRTICDTLENSRACLKAGRSYPLSLVKCHQFGRKMIRVGKKQACEACAKQEEVSHKSLERGHSVTLEIKES